MGDSQTEDVLSDLARALGEKAPNSVKEIGKVLVEMTTKFVEAISDLKGEVKKLDLSNNGIKAQIESVGSSIGDINKYLEEFNGEIKSLRQELTEVKSQSIECKKENQRLDRELNETKKQLIELKQYSRRNNIELKGVPHTMGEDLNETVRKIATSLRVDLSDSDVDAVHRVPTKGNGPDNIILKFTSRTKRDMILQTARKNRLTTSVLGFGSNEPIYANDHLCRENKILLGKAIQAKREKNRKFAWVSDGKILMRKQENSKVIHLTSEGDLSQIQ